MKKNIIFNIFLISSVMTYGQDILWEKSFGGKHSEYLFDAQPTLDYGFILAGSSLSQKTGNKSEDGSGNLDYWIWKMDESGELDWQKNYGGSGTDLLQSIRHTKDGGYILGGNSDSEIGFHKKDSCKGKEDYWIIKLNAKGDEQWQRTLGGTGQEILKSILPTKDGGYLLAGSSSSGICKLLTNGGEDEFGKSEKNFGNLDFWAVKLDSKGKVEWQRTIGGRYKDQLQECLQTDDGGYLLGGFSNSPESGNKSEKCYGNSDYMVVKLAEDGTIEWQKVYGGNGEDQLTCMLQCFDGNYILGGSSNSDTSGNKNASSKNGMDFWVIKIKPDGEIIWQNTYDYGKVDLLTSIVENEDHSLLMGGYARTEKTKLKKTDKEGINDYVATKVDENGEEKWTSTIGSNGDDILKKVIEVRDGGYILAGTSKGKISRDRKTSNGGSDFWVAKLVDKEKKKEKKKYIEAFPNPTAQFTNIVVGYEFLGGTCYVYDLSGRQLDAFSIKDRIVPVDLGSYPVGVYVIEIATEVQRDGIKVIKGIN